MILSFLSLSLSPQLHSNVVVSAFQEVLLFRSREKLLFNKILLSITYPIELLYITPCSISMASMVQSRCLKPPSMMGSSLGERKFGNDASAFPSTIPQFPCFISQQ